MTDLGVDVRLLENLLGRDTNNDSSDDDQPANSLSSKMGPGNIGSTKKKEQKDEKKSVYEKKQTKDIWNVDEVEEGAEFDTSDDPRLQPDYEIIYKQKLTSEELFLQMGNKTNATSSCEDMIVKIKLPGVAKINEIDVNVVDNFLDCRSSKYRLGLHLPHPVDSESCSAKWDPKECNLIVTMSMNRELDYINF